MTSRGFIEKDQMGNGCREMTQMRKLEKHISPQTEHLLGVTHNRLDVSFSKTDFSSTNWGHGVVSELIL